MNMDTAIVKIDELPIRQSLKKYYKQFFGVLQGYASSGFGISYKNKLDLVFLLDLADVTFLDNGIAMNIPQKWIYNNKEAIFKSPNLVHVFTNEDVISPVESTRSYARSCFHTMTNPEQVLNVVHKPRQVFYELLQDKSSEILNGYVQHFRFVYDLHGFLNLDVSVFSMYRELAETAIKMVKGHPKIDFEPFYMMFTAVHDLCPHIYVDDDGIVCGWYAFHYRNGTVTLGERDESPLYKRAQLIYELTN